MIAACPKCHTRYRVQPEQLGPDGARLRCSHCSSVFRVRLPPQASEASAQRGAAERSHQDAPAQQASAQRGAAERSHQDAPAQQASAQRGAAERSHQDASAQSPISAPPVVAPATPAPAAVPRPVSDPDPREPGPDFDRDRLVVVAHADAEMSKTVAEALELWGLQVLVAYDGVEAILSIQRTLPRVVVLDAALPKMYGFQVCEVVKRNDSLRQTRVVLVGAVHKDDRYRRAPSEIYGADVYVEPPDLPDALHGILRGFGIDLRGTSGNAVPDPPLRLPGRFGHVARGGQPASVDVAAFESMPAGERAQDHAEPRIASPPRVEAAPAPIAPRAAADPLAAERAKAERLARIIVSDIALYNPEKFAAAARSGGDALAAMHDELEEGRALFRERIDARVRAERDHLAEELVRAAKARSGS